jgi:anti-anti-sigma factor
MTTQTETVIPEVRVNGIALVAVDGELDLATAKVFGERLVRLIDGGCPRLVVDVAGLTFCDSSGLSALLRASEHASSAGGSVTLVGIRPQLSRILQITDLDRQFEAEGVARIVDDLRYEQDDTLDRN